MSTKKGVKKVVEAKRVVRTPGGTRMRMGDDGVLYQASPSGRLRAWRPANTPVFGTPKRAAAGSSGGSRKRSRRSQNLNEQEIAAMLLDSGSEEYEEEEPEAAAEQLSILRLACSKLRDYEVFLQENELEAAAEMEQEAAAQEAWQASSGPSDLLDRAEEDEPADNQPADDVPSLRSWGDVLEEDNGASPLPSSSGVNRLLATASMASWDGILHEEASRSLVDDDVEDTVPAPPAPAPAPAPEPAPAAALTETFTWSEDFSLFSGQAETYVRTPGPTHALVEPHEIFQSFWDAEIMEVIVEQTNKYAWQTIAKLSEHDCISKNLDTWENTTVDELYRLFAVLNYMSIYYISRVDEYWTTGTMEMPKFRELMSRNRFQILMRFLHFVDNDEMTDRLRAYERKISKIEPILRHCNAKFSELFTPQRFVSLDESLLLWKGRLSWVQAIRSKAARFGIKSFDLCEADSGYTIKTLLYAGKNSSMVEGSIHGFENPTAKVVLELMDGYLDVGHCVVMDNWYNQLELTRVLKKRGTDVLGTMNRRRKNVPPEIKTLKDNDLARGQQIARHCGDIALMAWKDVKLVTTISTFLDDEQSLGQRAGVEINRPIAIKAYNTSMEGVDLRDQKLSMFLFERKRGKKWYIKVFRRLLNISMLNAYIIYTHNVTTDKLSHRNFREAISEGLLRTFPRVQVQNALPVNVTDVLRLDSQNHFPDYIPVTAKSRGIQGKRRCARCSELNIRKTVTTMCTKCNVGLCFGSCYSEYHTLKNLKNGP